MRPGPTHYAGHAFPAIVVVLMLLIGTGRPVRAQSWAGAGIPFRIAEMSRICADTIADALYFCGEASLNNDNDFGDQAIPVYTHGQWDTLGIFAGRPTSAVRWHDTLFVSGEFPFVNGVPMRGVVFWDGTAWQPTGDFDVPAVYKLKVVGGVLYALGSFERIDAVPYHGIARWGAGHWNPVGSMDLYTTANIQDLVMYRDTLVATGVIRFSGTEHLDVGYLDGEEWRPLGQGILGTFGTGRSLAVYHDELYVGGSIYITAGNAGHGIMRWNGSEYLPVGGSIQGSCNTFSCPAGALDMVVRDGLLWVAGSFFFADHQPTPGIATWDGERWCSVPGDLSLPINAITFFHDTLFAACFHYAEGEPVYSGARFIGTSYVNSCSIPTGIASLPTEHPVLRIGQDEAGNVCAYGLPAGSLPYRILDASGRAVRTSTVRAQHGVPIALDTTGLAQGVYLFHCNGRAIKFQVP